MARKRDFRGGVRPGDEPGFLSRGQAPGTGNPDSDPGLTQSWVRTTFDPNIPTSGPVRNHTVFTKVLRPKPLGNQSWEVALCRKPPVKRRTPYPENITLCLCASLGPDYWSLKSTTGLSK